MENTAVVPVKVAVPTAVPLANNVTLVILAGFPEPVAVRVNEDMLTVEELGLVMTTCWIGTLVAPESWLELGGGLVPWEAATVTIVGVEEGVDVGVAVFARVFVGVKVGVRVTV